VWASAGMWYTVVVVAVGFVVREVLLKRIRVEVRSG